MQLTHSFSLPVVVEEAWLVLLDIERIAPCMPGATLETLDAEEFSGKVRIKVGPVTVTYRGSVRFLERDADKHRIVLEASGSQARGSGTAKATLTATLHDAGEGTEVTVRTNLAVTGKPAQFGRAVLVDVGNKLIGAFADCLAADIVQPAASEPAPLVASAPLVEETAERIVPAQEAATAELPKVPAELPGVTADLPEAPVEVPAQPAGEPDPSSAAASTVPTVATPVESSHVADTSEPAEAEPAGSPMLKRVVLVAGPVALVGAGLVLVVVLRRHR